MTKPPLGRDRIADMALVDRLALAESRGLLRQRKEIAKLKQALETEQQRVLRLRRTIARLRERLDFQRIRTLQLEGKLERKD